MRANECKCEKRQIIWQEKHFLPQFKLNFFTPHFVQILLCPFHPASYWDLSLPDSFNHLPRSVKWLDLHELYSMWHSCTCTKTSMDSFIQCSVLEDNSTQFLHQVSLGPLHTEIKDAVESDRCLLKSISSAGPSFVQFATFETKLTLQVTQKAIWDALIRIFLHLHVPAECKKSLPFIEG